MSRLEVTLSVDAEKLSKPDLVTLVRNLQSQKQGWDGKLSALAAEVETLAKQLTTAREDAGELPNTKAALAALEQKQTAFEAEREQLQASLAEARKAAVGAEEARKTNVELREKLSAANEETAGLSAKLKERSTTTEDLTAQLRETEKNRQNAAGELTKLSKRIATLELSLEKAETSAKQASVEGMTLKKQRPDSSDSAPR